MSRGGAAPGAAPAVATGPCVFLFFFGGGAEISGRIEPAWRAGLRSAKTKKGGL